MKKLLSSLLAIGIILVGCSTDVKEVKKSDDTETTETTKENTTPEFTVGDPLSNDDMDWTTGNQRIVPEASYSDEEMVVFDIGITSKKDNLSLDFQVTGVTASNQVVDPESVYSAELEDMEQLNYLYDELDKGQFLTTYVAFKKSSGVTKVEVEGSDNYKFIINLLPY